MIYTSAWEDCRYTASTTDFKFTLSDNDGNVLYAGRAVARPNEATVSVNIGRIVQGFVTNASPRDWDFSTFTNEKGVMDIHLLDSASTEVETYKVLYCWDYSTRYDNVWDVAGYRLSRQINSHTADGMYLFNTTISSGMTTTSQQVGVGNSCGDAAIYYLSPMGGWCSFLFEGKVARTDDVERTEYSTYADARSNMFGKRTMANTIRSSWELSTHHMGDLESDRFVKDIIATPMAYLHLFKEGKTIPVTIDTNSLKCLTYRNNGHKMFTYTINVTESQERQDIC